MQQQLGNLEEELKKVKEELAASEEEKFRALDELGEMKKVAEAANSRLSDALSAEAQARDMSRVHEELEQASVESAKKRDQAWQLEIEAVQKQHALDVEALSSAFQELERVRKELVSVLEAKDAAIKEAAEARNTAEASAKRIMDLCSELERAKSKDDSLEKQRHELHRARESEPRTIDEVEKANDSEAKMLDEAKLEIASLQKKVQSLEELVAQTKRDLDVSHDCLEKAKLETHSIKEVVDPLQSELQVAKESLAYSQEEEGVALSKVRNLTQEINMLRNEVKLATDAEETSKKAMDDLALVLVEVSKETKDVKEELRLKKLEIEGARQEAVILKQMVKPTELRYQSLLEEARKEIDQVRSVSERLKLEAEDSILAWNQKELEFVNCIKRAEEESNASKQENSQSKLSLKMAEDVANVAKEENCKLRDILKQALNETSAAKEAAQIAKEESSQLKDNLLDKEDVLQELAKENERLRIKETAGQETIKELKRLLSSKSAEELTAEEKIFKKQDSLMKEHKDNLNIKGLLNLKFQELQVPNGRKNEDEDPEMAEMLKGSIFDVMDSPDCPKPVSLHRKSSSSVFSDDGQIINLENMDHLDVTQLDDTEDKNSQRKKRQLLRRFGELIRRTSFHRRESSVG